MNKPSLVASGDKQGSFSRKNLFNYWILSSGAIKDEPLPEHTHQKII
jgi:hypothetical protein